MMSARAATMSAITTTGVQAVGPNELLRTARERTRSREVPGECMSRREVAQAVNGYLYRTTGRVYDFDAHHLAKLERGVHRWPMAPYRAALRWVLGAATDAELGFRPPRRRAARTRSPSASPEVDWERFAGAVLDALPDRQALARPSTGPGSLAARRPRVRDDPPLRGGGPFGGGRRACARVRHVE
jgi:hypothetical protein